MRKVVLNPGGFFFSVHGEKIKTLLGSCIAITLWHPERRVGGMCHYLLPYASQIASDTLDGRYADQAMALFLAELKKTGTYPGEFQVKVFGGGNMFPEMTTNSVVGDRNIEAAHRLLRMHGFSAPEVHVGCSGHRTVILDLATGDTWLRWQKGESVLS